MRDRSIVRGIVFVAVCGALACSAICSAEDQPIQPIDDAHKRLAAWYRGEVHDPSVTAWRRAALISSGVDLLTTEIALARCGSTCAEGNPLGGSRAKRIALKAGSGALVSILSRHYARRNPGKAKAILGAGVAFHACLSINAVAHW
jgi:hypothetical protein